MTLSQVPRNDSPPVDDGFVVRRDMFEACIGHYVRVAYGRRSVRLWIVQVEDLPSARATQTVGHPDGFTVLLRGPLAAPLAQGTYRIDSPTLGTFSLFLVPGVVRGAMTYAAVFNRFVPAP